MSDEQVIGTTEKDGDHVAKNETKIDNESKELQTKEPKSVSFNRDVHIKRFGKPRELRSASTEHQRPTRKEPFTHLSEQELIEEANKVLAQADSVTCTADHPPEKFFSLPHRRKIKEQVDRRNSDDSTIPDKQPLGRSTSDVSQRKKKERTSLSTLFRKAQKTKIPEAPVAVKTKPVIVKRSKSDVSDLKSNTSLNTQPKPIRKRSGSETEEFLKSLRNKKTQLSPIIESSPREDYFKKTPPLDSFLKKKLFKIDSNKSDETSSREIKVNPVEKPPRYKSPDKEPKPPARSKRSKSSDKELSPPITDTPKRHIDINKTITDDDIINVRGKDLNPVVVKDRIKDTIKELEDNVNANKSMIHSSQQPPEKPPLTRGHTVDPIVRILKEDQQLGTPSKMRMITPQNNQAFSYIKSNNLFGNSSRDKESPLNNIDKGVVYAQVVRDKENGLNNSGKQTIHTTYSPARERFGNISDEDEGYEDKPKFTPYTKTIDTKTTSCGPKGYNISDSNVKPKYREYKLTSYEDYEPTYANEYSIKEDSSREYIDATVRGSADGTDDKRKPFIEVGAKDDLGFNELSHRRKLLESRLNARRTERERINAGETITRYLTEKDPIYEANKRMEATEKYVNETARYYSRTLERDAFAENSVSEDFSKNDSDNQNVKYGNDSRVFQNVSKDRIDRREFIDTIGTPRFKNELKMFPPEPEYEPPSLELEKPVLTPDEYTEKKYKAKIKSSSTSHEVIPSGQKYKKYDWFSKKKGHYASNPDINQDSEEYYANYPLDPSSYHNSLKRENNRDKYLEENYGIRRHDSNDSRDYYTSTRSPRRLEVDSRLVDSGIENDFRKESGEIHGSRYLRHESDDDIRDTSLFLASERQHTEDNYPSEQIYANGEYLARFESTLKNRSKDYVPRERSADDHSKFSARNYRYNTSQSRQQDKISAKPPKPSNKKLYGLDVMKQLFSRDSSKKSKREQEIQSRTRVLKSPEHLADDASAYRRYKDPEPSDEEQRPYRYSREDIRHRSSDPRDSDPEKYRDEYQYENKYRTERREGARRYQSSERDHDRRSLRPSDDSEHRNRKTRSKTTELMDSPALAERYRERRRLATPSPPPSPPVRHSSTNWFKSLDRLTGMRNKTSKAAKSNSRTVDDETSVKSRMRGKPLNSPAKNLRFFGDTDQEYDTNVKHSSMAKTKSHPSGRHTLLRKTISNSSAGLDEVDRSIISTKSPSLSNLHREDTNRRLHKRNLHNISEVQSNSETDSHFGRKLDIKPPIPYDRRSRSHSNSKTLKGSRNDVRKLSRERMLDERGSSSELRGSKQEYGGDMKHSAHRRAPTAHSGESSTEGDSSHQSQRSMVYLHATTVGDIPDPGRLARNRSRDDVSSVNSSNIQVRTTQKSFSIFAPWTPKHYSDQHDVHYDQKPRKPRNKENEPVKKYSSTKNLADRNSTLQKNKSYSQTTLNRRPPSSRLTSSNQTLNRKPKRKDDITTLSRGKNKKTQSNEVLNLKNERVSRSASMSEEKEKKPGWFNLSNKNKKQEINTRVR